MIEAEDVADLVEDHGQEVHPALGGAADLREQVAGALGLAELGVVGGRGVHEPAVAGCRGIDQNGGAVGPTEGAAREIHDLEGDPVQGVELIRGEAGGGPAADCLLEDRGQVRLAERARRVVHRSGGVVFAQEVLVLGVGQRWSPSQRVVRCLRPGSLEGRSRGCVVLGSRSLAPIPEVRLLLAVASACRDSNIRGGRDRFELWGIGAGWLQNRAAGRSAPVGRRGARRLCRRRCCVVSGRALVHGARAIRHRQHPLPGLQRGIEQREFARFAFVREAQHVADLVDHHAQQVDPLSSVAGAAHELGIRARVRIDVPTVAGRREVDTDRRPDRVAEHQALEIGDLDPQIVEHRQQRRVVDHSGPAQGSFLDDRVQILFDDDVAGRDLGFVRGEQRGTRLLALRGLVDRVLGRLLSESEQEEVEVGDVDHPVAVEVAGRDRLLHLHVDQQELEVGLVHDTVAVEVASHLRAREARVGGPDREIVEAHTVVAAEETEVAVDEQ